MALTAETLVGDRAIEVGTFVRACPGQSVSGDMVEVFRRGAETWVVVADGLGHGDAARVAAEQLMSIVARSQASQVADVLAEAHSALGQTRGCVAHVLAFNAEDGTLTSTGVGNIRFRTTFPSRIRPWSTPGILGRRLRRVQASRSTLRPRDVVVIHSDGISSRWDFDDLDLSDPARTARQLVEVHGKAVDDASCAVLRVL